MARERDDEFADDDKRRPRRRDNDDDAGDRPARRRDRDDDDDGDRPTRRRSGGDNGEPSGLDKYFGNLPISVIVAVVTGLCCSCIPIILGGIGLATTKTPEGKKGATITLVVGIVWLAINIILSATGVVDVRKFTK